MNYSKYLPQLRPMYTYIKKQAENEKFLKNLEIGGTFTLIAIFLFFAIMPTITTISSLIGDIKSKETFIKKVDLKLTSVIKAQESYAEIQEKYSLVEDSFPSMAHYFNGASNIGTIFRDSALDINQLSLSLSNDEEKNKQFLNSYQISVNGEGKYSSILEMIKKTLNNRRLVDTTNIQLSQVNSGNNNYSTSENIKVTLSSKLYFLSDNEKK